MFEVTIVELSPQLVLGMHKIGAYREIPVMFQRICDFALSKNILLAAYPAFLLLRLQLKKPRKSI